MSYEAWRITYQSSEAAARAAYAEMMRLREQLAYASKALENIKTRAEASNIVTTHDKWETIGFVRNEAVNAIKIINQPKET